MPDLKIAEAAVRLGVSRQRTNTLANDGVLHVVPDRKPRHVTEASVVAYAAARLGTATPAAPAAAEIVERSDDPLPSHQAIREIEHLRDDAIMRNDPDTLNTLTLALYRETKRAQVNDRYILRSEAQEAFETAMVSIRRFLFTRDQMDMILVAAAPDLPLAARGAIMEGFTSRFTTDVTPLVKTQHRIIANENGDTTET